MMSMLAGLIRLKGDEFPFVRLVDSPSGSQIDIIEEMLDEDTGDISSTFDGWRYSDQRAIDRYHSFSIFTMYWPALAIYALVGRE